jgi:thiol-disulfide isomerase/thioredoxin
MALTPSLMAELGTSASDFDLPDSQGNRWSLASFADQKALLVMFICNHCPYVMHLKPALAQFGKDYVHRGLGVIAINANDAKLYPQDSPEQMARDVAEFGYQFPYVYDESQLTAKAYHATCTPDFFLYNQQRKLVYRGQFDSSRPGNDIPATGRDLRNAVDKVLAGLQPDIEQLPSVGCNIKWQD